MRFEEEVTSKGACRHAGNEFRLAFEETTYYVGDNI